MRMRFKPYAGPELAACPFHMNDATGTRAAGERPLPGPGQPLHLELGCGKGGFLARLASRNPDVNYIGVDITDKVLILAKRNIERIYAEQGLPIDNVKTLAHDIERIPTLLDKADRVERIYINFCNPWNKKANHKKHRLTHTRQLLLYRPFLADGAEIWFKCDDDDLFKDTLRYMAEAGFDVTWQTRDRTLMNRRGTSVPNTNRCSRKWASPPKRSLRAKRRCRKTRLAVHPARHHGIKRGKPAFSRAIQVREGGFARFITKAYDSSRTPRMGTRSYQPIRRQKRIRLSIVSARSLLLRGFASRKGTATRLMLNTADTPIS